MHIVKLPAQQTLSHRRLVTSGRRMGDGMGWIMGGDSVNQTRVSAARGLRSVFCLANPWSAPFRSPRVTAVEGKLIPLPFFLSLLNLPPALSSLLPPIENYPAAVVVCNIVVTRLADVVVLLATSSRSSLVQSRSLQGPDKSCLCWR